MPYRANRLLPLITALVMFACALSGAYAAENDSSPSSRAASLARIRAHEKSRIELIDKLRPAVACIFDHGNHAGGGSGMIIDRDGYGLTNFHVVAGMLDDRLGDVGLPDGKIREMEVLGVDLTGDVAMFKLKGDGPFPFVEMGNSDSLALGDFALAMGNPFLLAEDYTPTVTVGIISGLHRYQEGAGESKRALRYTDCIQVDASINPGNSGGPLFNAEGKLIGINGRVSIEERGRVNVGVGYAISINQVKRFLPLLRAGTATKHATAGFTVGDKHGTVVVDEMLEDSAAFKAGIRLGDVLVKFAGRPMDSANQFGSWLGVFPAGWPVDVECQRDGKSASYRFRLAELPLPREPRNPHSKGPAKDPFAPTPATEAANARATRRALDLYRAGVGDPKVLSKLSKIEWVRSAASAKETTAGGTPTSQPEGIVELREKMPWPPKPGNAASMESAIRWDLLTTDAKSLAGRCRVAACDEVSGRIVGVLECKSDDSATYRASFDDATGDLLRIEFTEGVASKPVVVEYGELRADGSARLPHARSIFVDGIAQPIEDFETVKATAE